MQLLKNLLCCWIVLLVSCDNGGSPNKDKVVVDGECIDTIRFPSIVGGRKVSQSDYDSKNAVLLLLADSSGKLDSICTATPITSKVLITAAHCIKDVTHVMAAFYPDLTCQSGFRISEATRALKFKAHPDYEKSFDSSNADLGLVLLETQIPSAYPIFRISQNPQSTQSDLFLYGYGRTGTKNEDSGYLRFAQISRADYEVDENSYVIQNNGFHGICQGDSGGAALIKVSGRFEVAGINSFGRGPEDDVCGGTGNMILVQPYMNWVRETLYSWGQYLSY